MLTDPSAKNLLFLDFGASNEIVGLITHELSETAAALHCQSETLTPRLLTELSPDCVVFALFGPRKDAYQMITLLERLTYRGALMVLCPALQHSKLVEAELRALGPGKRLTLVVFAPSQPE